MAIASNPNPDRRRALLDAAVEQIARKGARGMRVDEVAKSAGVSAGLIYHHFGDRSTLLRMALEHVGERADNYTQPADGTGRDMLLQLLADEIQDDEEIRVNSAARGELRDAAIFDASLQPTLLELTERWVRDIAELVTLGHVDGSIADTVAPDATGITLSALAEGLSSRWLASIMTTDEAREHLREAIETLLGDPPS